MWRIAILAVPILIGRCDAGTPPSATEAVGPIDWAKVRPADVPPGQTAVLVLGEDGSRSARFERIDPSRLAGDYYSGDGLGYNLYLTIKESGRYQCSWSGCLGTYGRCSGRWSAAAMTLILTTDKSEGVFESKPLGPLSPLMVIALGDHYMLVEKGHREFFDECGPSNYACLHQEKDSAALDAAEERSAEIRSKTEPPKTAGPSDGAKGSIAELRKFCSQARTGWPRNVAPNPDASCTPLRIAPRLA
jgi:hypothetical protein